MKNILLYILAFAGFIANSVAQNTGNYTPLICEGKIPSEFITPSTIKYKKEIEKTTKNVKKKERGDRKRYALESSFVIDDLLQSGLVLFNDPVSVYLNDILKELIKKDETKLQHVRVYTLRSSSVNAFATSRGAIFVTLGLVAQVENEAQLAFILAHELVHVQENHGLDFFLEAEKIERSAKGKDVLNQAVFENELLSKCRYSKELENEADTKGLDRFLASKYSISTLNTVFDVLKYAQSPFEEVPFDKNILQSADYRFPDDYWLASVKAVSGEDENSDDSKSSHPNLGSRRKAVLETVKNKSDERRSNFIVSQTRFAELQQRARFEIPMMLLQRSRTSDAVYASFLLLRKYPDNQYVQKCLLKALYLHAKYKNDDDYTLLSKHEDVEGEVQQVHHFMEKIPAKEMTVAALHYGLGLQQKSPADKEIKTIIDDLFYLLAFNYKNLDEFSATGPQAVAETAPVVPAADSASKYQTIRSQLAKTRTGAESTYWKFAFVDALDSPEFKEAYKKAGERLEKDKAFEKKAKTSKYRKQQAKLRKKGYQLGIDKIVVVDPYYLSLDARKENSVQYIKTETGQDHYRELIQEIAKKSDLKVTMVDVCAMKDNQTSQFNDNRFLNDWFSDQVHYDDLSLTPGLNQNIIDSIAAKYGTDYFLWTGVISLREKNKYVAIKMLFGVFYWPTMPFMAYSAFKPKHDMMQYAILFDVRTGRRQVLKLEYFDRKDTDTVLKAHLYDVFNQIKSK